MRAVTRRSGIRTRSPAARRIGLVSGVEPRPMASVSRPPVRPQCRGRSAARSQQREQNIVVLALARLVREAIDAEETENSDEPSPPGRIAETTHTERVA